MMAKSTKKKKNIRVLYTNIRNFSNLTSDIMFLYKYSLLGYIDFITDIDNAIEEKYGT
jgi:hypothetical protein